MSDGIEWTYRIPAAEFELRRINVSVDGPFHSGPAHGPDIVILAESDDAVPVTVSAAGKSLQLQCGDVFLAPFGVDFSVEASARATLYRATVPEASARNP
jgi:hypothetical protein